MLHRRLLHLLVEWKILLEIRRHLHHSDRKLVKLNIQIPVHIHWLILVWKTNVTVLLEMHVVHLVNIYIWKSQVIRPLIWVIHLVLDRDGMDLALMDIHLRCLCIINSLMVEMLRIVVYLKML